MAARTLVQIATANRPAFSPGTGVEAFTRFVDVRGPYKVEILYFQNAAADAFTNADTFNRQLAHPMFATVALAGFDGANDNTLGDLTVTDRLLLETTEASFWLQVTDIQVVNSAEAELNLWTEDRLLTLVTCYPLDAQVPGGPLRLVVTAEPMPALAML